jgi:hypothetical protein
MSATYLAVARAFFKKRILIFTQGRTPGTSHLLVTPFPLFWPSLGVKVSGNKAQFEMLMQNNSPAVSLVVVSDFLSWAI